MNARAITRLIVVLSSGACSRPKDLPPANPAVRCKNLKFSFPEAVDAICPFYPAYAGALDEKKTERILPFISDAYRGSDGLNAAQIRSAIRKQMQSFPWRNPVFEEFMLSESAQGSLVRHRMTVSTDQGKIFSVAESILWSRDTFGKWRIIDWLHK